MSVTGPNNITRAIIYATVDRGIREVEEDPKRSIRKLADMGRRYTKGRFLENVMDIAQEMLRNDNCPYYDAVATLLRNTNRRHIKDCGINIGYNSLTYGGKKIRDMLVRLRHQIPWTLMFRFNNRKSDGMKLADIQRLIREANKYGIFTFMIRLEGTLTGFDDLAALFADCKDSAFLCFMPDQRLNTEHLQICRQSTNTLFLFPLSGLYTEDNLAQMKKEKVFHALSIFYNDQSAEEIIHDTAHMIPDQFRTAFVITVPEDSCSPETLSAMAAHIKEGRIKAAFPFIPFDYFGDAQDICRIMSSDCCFCEFQEDGSVRTADCFYPENMLGKSLEQIFQTTLGKS